MSSFEFTEQFNQLSHILRAFALNLTKDEEAANDLLQETAYKAYKYRDMYRSRTNLRAWLMTIMRNTFINNYRRKKRRQRLGEGTGHPYAFAFAQGTTSNQGESNIQIEEIQNAIERLEEWARVPFLMHYNGFKYEEIARDLEIPLGTVKSRIFSARKTLRAALQDLYQTRSLEEMLNR